MVAIAELANTNGTAVADASVTDVAAPVPCKEFRTEDKLARMKEAVKCVLKGLGEDIEREGLLDTPKRVAKALLDVTLGYRQTPASVLGTALFHEDIVKYGESGIVLVRDIDFASTSEETFLPFHGRCHVAYVPNDGVVLGLSKFARLTKQCAKRLQTQERLSKDVATILKNHLSCEGVAVVVQARHLQYDSQFPAERVSACVGGCFATEGSTHLQELLTLLSMEDLPKTAIQTMEMPADSKAVAPPKPEQAHPATDDMEAAVRQLLIEMGEDPARQGLEHTCARYVSSLLASTSGYHQSLPEPLPKQGASESAPLRTHRFTFTSQCEHHMLPFYGHILVAYTAAQEQAVSEEHVAHIVRMFTQRLQVQERITHQVADAIMAVADTAGVMVVVSAAHMCMVARGVENHAGATTSLATRGTFKVNPEMRRTVLREFASANVDYTR